MRTVKLSEFAKNVFSVFIAKQHGNKTCSKECSTQNRARNMSEARTGQKPWNSGKAGVYSAETRRKMGAKNVGKILSAEHKRSISAGLNSHYSAADGPNKGKTFSTEHKNKISNSLKAYRAKIENISHDTIQTEPDHVEDISKLKE